MRKWLAILSALAASGFWVSHMPLDRVARGQNDFLGLYLGPRLLGTPALHDSGPAVEAIQLETAKVSMPDIVFIRPDFYALLLKPFTWLPYTASYICFTLLNLFALIWAAYLMRDRNVLWLIALSSIPILTSFMNGQDLPLVAAALLGAVVLERKSKSFAAGFVLALCAVKPHPFVFVPLALIAGRRWRMFAGATAGLAGLSFAACIFQGWNWPVGYVQFLMRPELHPLAIPQPNMRGVARVFAGESLVVEQIGCALVAACLLVAGWRYRFAQCSGNDEFEQLTGQCILGGLLVSHHLAVHDWTLLLCALTLTAPASRLYQIVVAAASPFAFYVLLFPSWAAGLPGLAMIAGMVASLVQPRTLAADGSVPAVEDASMPADAVAQ